MMNPTRIQLAAFAATLPVAARDGFLRQVFARLATANGRRASSVPERAGRCGLPHFYTDFLC